MKGLLKGLRYIARLFEEEKEPEMQIGKPTDVKHVAHIGWEGPSATTPSWMHDYKSPVSESSNKKGTSSRNKGRRKSSNSPAESPSRASKRSAGKHRDQTDSSFELPKQSRHKKSKGTPPPPHSTKSKDTDISVRAVYPCVGLGSSTGR